MKEEESEPEPNWFLRWEEELPSPEELMPLSQSLITPDLALALGIITTSNSNSGQHRSPPRPPNLTIHSPAQTPSSQNHQSHHLGGGDYDLSEIGGGNSGGGGGGSGGGGGEEQARTLKRPRLVWTPQLHKRFVDAVSHLGIKHAVPKTIMQLMSVDGLTRENVASHLQKYRLYLKRMQGISSGSAGAHAAVSHSDEKLFASGPIPHHFLTQRPTALGPSGPEQFMPFAPIASSLQQQQQQMAAAASHHQQQFYNHRHMGSIGSSLDHGGFFGRQQQPQLGIQRMGRPVGVGLVPPLPATNFIEDSDSGAGGGGRKVLTLFPDD